MQLLVPVAPGLQPTIDFTAMSSRLDAALYSPWFLLTVIIPAVILLPLAWRRSNWLFPAFPCALVASWLAFSVACHCVANAQNRIAIEYGTPISDTGITFAPIFYGIPISLVVTTLLATIATGVYLWRHSINHGRHLPTGAQDSANPYSPPSR